MALFGINGPTGPTGQIYGITGPTGYSHNCQSLHFDVLTGNFIDHADLNKYNYILNIIINAGKIVQIIVLTKSPSEILHGEYYYNNIYGVFEEGATKIKWISQNDFTDFAKSLLEKAEAIVWRIKELNLYF